MIYELTIIVVLLVIYLVSAAGIRYRKIIKSLTDENLKLQEDKKVLKFNYDNLLKIYKTTLNKIKNLQRQLKNKGK